MTKYERQGAILRLVEQNQLSTQAEVTEALREQGFDAVQATVSRDIAQLGLVKVRNGNGRLVYALPGADDLKRLESLAAALRRWVSGMKAAGQLLVLDDAERLRRRRSPTRSTTRRSRRSRARSPARTRSSSPPATA